MILSCIDIVALLWPIEDDIDKARLRPLSLEEDDFTSQEVEEFGLKLSRLSPKKNNSM